MRGEMESPAGGFPHGSAFSTWEWLASGWRACARSDRLLVLALRDFSCSLMGVGAVGSHHRASWHRCCSRARGWNSGCSNSTRGSLPRSSRCGMEKRCTRCRKDSIRHTRLGSVGYVLRGRLLRNLIDRGIRRYDFLGGEDESKTRWGA